MEIQKVFYSSKYVQYTITPEGKVFSKLKSNGKLRPRSTIRNHNGHLRIWVGNKKFGRTMSVHRIVASAFIPNPDNLPIVHHKDSNPQNNNVSNLQWVTYKENTQEAIKVGRHNLLNNTSVRGVVMHMRKTYDDKDIAAITGLELSKIQLIQ